MGTKDKDYLTVGLALGYENHPQYGEWLIEGNNGPRPCRFENWTMEDLWEYVGGDYLKETK